MWSGVPGVDQAGRRLELGHLRADDLGRTVWAFGADQYGELGNGTSSQTGSYFTPVQVIFPASGPHRRSLANPMPYDTAIAIDVERPRLGLGGQRRL